MPSKERSAERLAAVFFLGVLLFSPLALKIFDAGPEGTLFGVPTLILYVFAAWAGVIASIWGGARTLDEPDPPPEEPVADALMSKPPDS